MAILKIARMGHPILRVLAKELTPAELMSAPVQLLIDNMIETMRDANGIGLAAPQVHHALALAVIEIAPDNERYPEMGTQGLLVLANPKITILDPTEQSFWEGCLSVPGLRGLVHRPRKIRVNFLDRLGEAQEIIAEDFLSTVFQHELDHLAATLYVDKIRDPKNLAFIEEYQRYLLPQSKEQELKD